jgi:hypothetical protein
MPDRDAGAAFKAALTYMAGGEFPALPAGAKLAFAALRSLIDLSRMKAAAGRAGGKARNIAVARHKQTPAGSVAGGIAESAAGNTAVSIAEGKPDKTPPPEGFDMLAGLDAFR